MATGGVAMVMSQAAIGALMAQNADGADAEADDQLEASGGARRTHGGRAPPCAQRRGAGGGDRCCTCCARNPRRVVVTTMARSQSAIAVVDTSNDTG